MTPNIFAFEKISSGPSNGMHGVKTKDKLVQIVILFTMFILTHYKTTGFVSVTDANYTMTDVDETA